MRNVKWTKLHGRLKAFVADSVDGGDTPDEHNLTGKALFKPLIPQGAMLPDIGDTPPDDVSYLFAEVEVDIINGEISHAGHSHVWLVCGLPGVDGPIHWRIVFSEMRDDVGNVFRPRTITIEPTPGVLSWSRLQPVFGREAAGITKGETGEPGPRGMPGAQGNPGKSAYQLASENGFTGSEQQWLQSLQGAKGDPGEPGKPGDTLNLTGIANTYTELPTLAAKDAGATYMVEDTGKMYVWSGSRWSGEEHGLELRPPTDAITTVAVAKKHMPVNLAEYVTSASDNTDEVLAAVAEAKRGKRGIFLPDGVTVAITRPVDMRYILDVDLRGTIRASQAGKIIVGHTSVQRPGQVIRIKEVAWGGGGDPTHAVLEVVGMKQAYMDVRKCPHMLIKADDSDPTIASVSYSTFSIGQIGNLQIQGWGPRGWITELVFIGGDIKNLTVSGEYGHNSITFFKPCFEGGLLNFLVGTRIRAVDARCEDGTKVRFGRNTNRIIIEDSFLSNPTTFSAGAVVEQDLGVDNRVMTAFDHYYRRHDLVALYAKAGSVEAPVALASQEVKAWEYWADTGVIPIRGRTPDIDPNSNTGAFEMTAMFFQSDVKAWRLEVYVYGEDGQMLTTGEGMDLTGGWRWDSGATSFRVGANGEAFRLLFNSPKVHFVRVRVRAGSAPPAFRWARLFAVMPSTSGDFPVLVARASVQYPKAV